MTIGIWTAAAILLVTLGISIWLGRLLRSDSLRARFLDHPNHRSLHHVPVPRSGGLAIHAAFVIAVLVFMALSLPLPDAGFWAGWGLVVAVSAWDDLRHVPVGVRLASHVIAAGLLLWALAPASTPTLAVLVTGGALVWFVNLFNFMDGMDGLAGLMAVTGSLCLAAAGLMQGDAGYALLAGVVAAAAGGFLFHNLPPARLFMGDAGSIGLGLVLGGLSLYGIFQGLFPWFVPLLTFLPFIADATCTLIVRILRRQRPWEAHREHVYQRLVLAGWPVTRVLVIEFLIMLACQLASLVLMTQVRT